MSCNSYESCNNKERENLRFPMDSESLYMQRIYDNQTANSRCYAKNPIEITEGFGSMFTWEMILKILVVILLIALFIILAKDSLFPKEQVNLNIQKPTEIGLSSVKL